MGESRLALCVGYCLLPHSGLCVSRPYCLEMLSSNHIANKWCYDCWTGRTWHTKDWNITDTNLWYINITALVATDHRGWGIWQTEAEGVRDPMERFLLESTLTHRPSRNSQEKTFYFKMWDPSVIKAVLWALHIFCVVHPGVGPLQTPSLSEETAVRVDSSSSSP